MQCCCRIFAQLIHEISKASRTFKKLLRFFHALQTDGIFDKQLYSPILSLAVFITILSIFCSIYGQCFPFWIAASFNNLCLLYTSICDPDNHCVFFNRCTQRIDVCAHCRPLLKEGPPSRFVACHRGGIVKTLSAQGLQKKYGSQEVISNASLKVYSGELVAVVGKSGVGKTTLCSILAGFLKADGGEILLDVYKRQVLHRS